MGAIFVGGQVNEYHQLVKQQASRSPRERLRLGLLPDHRLPRPARHRRPDRLHDLSWPAPAAKFTPAQATAAIVVSYYWHFVDIVWIALFATIYFIQ